MLDKRLAFFSPAPHPADEASRQEAVDSFGLTEAAADPRLAGLVAQAAAIFGSGAAAISIIDGDRQNWIVRTGLVADGSPRALSFCGHVVHDEAMLVVPDAHADRRFAGNPLVTGVMAGVRFYAGSPLTHEGATLGALCVVDERPVRATSEKQRAELRRLAGEVMAILETYRR